MSAPHMTIRLRPEPEEVPQAMVPPPHAPKKKDKKMLTRGLFALAALLVLVGAGFGIRAILDTFLPAASGDPKEMVGRVSKLMVLPDEAPTVAVVSDLEKLKGQLFFARAHEGDIVLMYPKAQKAVLYNPTLNKIIEVAPITNDTQQ